MTMIATNSDIIFVDADIFYREFKERKEFVKNTEQVLLRELNHYKNECSTFIMLKDYSAGLALEKSGRIISVFNAGKYRRVGKVLLDKAIELGGCKLECNDVEQLRYIYGKSGFVPVSKAPLDANDIYYNILKSKENDKDHGTTLVFWIYSEKDHKLLLEDETKYIIDFCNILKFKTEEEAENFRDEILEHIHNLSPELNKYLSSIVTRVNSN